MTHNAPSDKSIPTPLFQLDVGIHEDLLLPVLAHCQGHTLEIDILARIKSIDVESGLLSRSMDRR